MMNPAIFAEDGPAEPALRVGSDIAEARQTAAPARESEQLFRSIVDALAESVCALDETGAITAANASWRDAVSSGSLLPPTAAEGTNYLAACEAITGPDASNAQALAAGVRAVLRGERQAFSMEYPCAAPAQPRWFAVRATRLPGNGPTRLVVAYEDITQYKAAITDERQRLARDLHDAVTQTLLAASAIADALPRVWERSPAEGKRGLRELRHLLLGAVTEMRALLLKLRPAATTEQRLGAALAQLTDTMTRLMQTPIALQVEEDHPLPPDIATAFYRITQEALNNISRHAQASQITVHLRAQPREVVLRVNDNGRGFDPRAIPPGHLGLAIMQERAASIGALVEIRSSPGQGAQIIATWVDAGKHTSK